MLSLRIYEEEIEERYHPEDEMKCPVHFCTGQEAVPTALYDLLKKMTTCIVIIDHMDII